MTNIVSSRIKCFEERISVSRRELSEMQLLEFHKTFVESCTMQFNDKEYEHQYKLNDNILECLRDAEEYLNEAVNNSACAKAESALSSLVHGINMLIHKQTLIKMADSRTSDDCVLDASVVETTGAENGDVALTDASLSKSRRLRARRFAISTSTQVDLGTDDATADTNGHASTQERA